MWDWKYYSQTKQTNINSKWHRYVNNKTFQSLLKRNLSATTSASLCVLHFLTIFETHGFFILWDGFALTQDAKAETPHVEICIKSKMSNPQLVAFHKILNHITNHNAKPNIWMKPRYGYYASIAFISRKDQWTKRLSLKTSRWTSIHRRHAEYKHTIFEKNKNEWKITAYLLLAIAFTKQWWKHLLWCVKHYFISVIGFFVVISNKTFRLPWLYFLQTNRSLEQTWNKLDLLCKKQYYKM